MTQPVEVSWFSALCDDDYEYLGVPDPALRQLLRPLPRHRAACRDGRLRQHPAALGLRPGHRLGGLRRGRRAAARAHVAAGGHPLRRALAAHAGAPARDPRPDARGPPHPEHHLERSGRRAAGLGAALCALPRGDADPARPPRRQARLPSRGVTTSSRSSRRACAPSRAAARRSTSAASPKTRASARRAAPTCS